MSPERINRPTRIYLDHNATTPIDPRVIEAMDPYLRELFGNPSSVEHQDGHLAATAVDRARGQVADAVGARASEIIFTGSCTEASNIALLGVARSMTSKRHIITSMIEHPAVLGSVEALERDGWRVSYLRVDEYGLIDPDDLRRAIGEDTALVSVMAANNEVGTQQPVKEIGAICAERGVLFHCDLAQAASYTSIDVERDSIHLASLSAHKTYGPKGMGALYVRSRSPRVRLAPIFYGGGQERGLRPGTLNTAGIVGMGAAFAIARTTAGRDADRLRGLCRRFCDCLIGSVPGTVLNGHPTVRLGNNLSFSIERLEPLALIRRLRERVSFSASSACSTDKIETSHVLKAMFGDGPRARGAFRIAPGRFTTSEQMEQAVAMISEEALYLRRL